MVVVILLVTVTFRTLVVKKRMPNLEKLKIDSHLNTFSGLAWDRIEKGVFSRVFFTIERPKDRMVSSPSVAFNFKRKAI